MSRSLGFKTRLGRWVRVVVITWCRELESGVQERVGSVLRGWFARPGYIDHLELDRYRDAVSVHAWTCRFQGERCGRLGLDLLGWFAPGSTNGSLCTSEM